MHPVLLTFGAVHVFSLSIFLILSWCVFSFLFWRAMRIQGVIEERIFDLMFYSTLVAFVFARMGFVLLHWPSFHNQFIKIFALWVQPGLSFYFGLGGAMAAFLLLSRYYKIRVGYVLDTIASALPPAIIIGAIGSLLDGSQVGRAAVLPWAINYVGYSARRHPIQIYEISGILLSLIILIILQKRARDNQWPYGIIGACFFILFSLLMFWLEFLSERTPYWNILSANQILLIIFFGQSVGALYVRSGGRDYMRRTLRRGNQSFQRYTKLVYERIFTRHT